MTVAGGDFVGARRAAEHRIAVREAAEALDDVVVLLGVAELLVVAAAR